MRAAIAGPEKSCLHCKQPFGRNRFSTGRLEDRGVFSRRKFCGKECQALAQMKPEATHKQTMMSRARKHKLSACQVCSATDRLHVHHVDKNLLNNAPANLMTLCVLCHNRVHAGLIALKPSETP